MTEGEEKAMGEDRPADWPPANGGAAIGERAGREANAAGRSGSNPRNRAAGDHEAEPDGADRDGAAGDRDVDAGGEDGNGAVGGQDGDGGVGRRHEDAAAGEGEPEDAGGTDVHERARQGVEHLQAAARELIAAARAALDVAEEVVNDPEAVGSLAGMVAGLSEMARRVRGGGWPPSGAPEPAPEDERQARVERIRVT